MSRYTDEQLLSLLEFSAKALGASDEEVFEFTRCVRPNGTVYGTRGKCKKGTEQSKPPGKTPRDVQGAISAIKKHPALKKYTNPKASYDDLHASVPALALKKHLGWGNQEIKRIQDNTEGYEGTIVKNGDKYDFYGAA